MKQVIDSGFIAMLESRNLQIQKPLDGLFGGNRKSKSYGSSPEFADYREYVSGDDLRRIDWNLYARFEKMFLKLFVDERQLHHRIYLDTSASMNWGEPKKSDMALKLVAALGFLSVKALDRVSFYAIGSHDCRDLSRTVVGRESFYQAANLLNRVSFDGEVDFGKAFLSTEDVGEGGGMSVIISDFLTDSNWKDAVDYLLYHKRQVVLIQILSSDERNPEISGKVLFLDSESVDEEDSKNFRTEITRSSLRAYQQALAYHQNELRTFCASRNVSFISVTSNESIEQMLFTKGMEVGLIQ